MAQGFVYLCAVVDWASRDQGSQFTSQAFTDVLAGRGIRISMDGKGAWHDNVFVERLWRTIKYDEVYLRAYESVSQARSWLARFIEFYNDRGTPHGLCTAGRFPVRRKRPNRPAVHNPAA